MKKRYIVVLVIMIVCILSTIKFTYGRFTYESEVLGTVTTTSRNPFESGTLAYSIVDNAMNGNTENQEKTIYSEEPKTKPAKEVSDSDERTLSVTEDDDGNSYYFRGNVKDNYIDFNNMCWRVVRIKGDGSIKLILEDKEHMCSEAVSDGSNASIGQGSWGYKGGWTVENPLDFDYENNELGIENGRKNAKQIIDEWLNNFDKKLLKEDNWCIGNTSNWYKNSDWNNTINTNDIEESDYVYSESYKRIYILKTTTLNCSVNDKSVKDFGGLLTIDEVVNAGFTTFDTRNDNIYLQLKNNDSKWWLLSVYGRGLATGHGSFCITKNHDGINALYMIRPSIVLKPEIKLISGDGTKGNAYKVDENPYEENTLAYEIVKNAQDVRDDKETDNTTKLSPVPDTIPAQQVSGIDEKTLSITEDDFGSSYYYRGNVEDNYLNFNNMCWRVVRIEGDGSVKLILYDKEHTCNEETGGDNAFIGTGEYGYKIGTIKELENVQIPDFENCSSNSENCAYPKLQKWFNDNLSSKKDILKNEKWNIGDIETLYTNSDELHNGFYAYFDNGHRLSNKNLSSNYATLLSKGVSFDSYIGLLTMDEAVLAGMVYGNNIKPNNNIYLNLNGTSTRTYTMLLSPMGIYSFDSNAIGIYELDKNTNFSTGNVSCTTFFSIRPSIVLNKDIKIKSGNGLKTSPYEIENNN